MKRAYRPLLLVAAVVAASVGPAWAQAAQRPGQAAHPYAQLAGRLQTDLRFTTDIAFPGGPHLEVKVYDWLIGPRQELQDFPLEGLATIEVKAGEVEVTVNGVTRVREEGEHFVVPPGAKLSLKVQPERGRGDNVVSLHGVVVIRK